LEDVSSAESIQHNMSARNVVLRGRDNMGDVMVQLRVLPESIDVDLKKLKQAISEKIEKLCKINEVKEEEIGFGLSALLFTVIIPDEEGKIDSVETAISSVKDVSQVDTRDVTLI
jgi:elongation factor 1-beta